MFNFSGSELIFLLLIALVVLGPEKLPDAIRRFGRTYAEFKKVTTGFQNEFRQVIDEPMREMRQTADAFKKAASLDVDGPPTRQAAKPSHDVMSTQTPASVVRDPDEAGAPPVVAVDGVPVDGAAGAGDAAPADGAVDTPATAGTGATVIDLPSPDEPEARTA